MTLGAPALACRFNNLGYNLLRALVLRMCERGKGMNVRGEIYPYAAWSTVCYFAAPVAFGGGVPGAPLRKVGATGSEPQIH